MEKQVEKVQKNPENVAQPETKVEKKGSKRKEFFLAGIIKNNPVLVMLLGLCPVIPATTSIINALMMFVAVLFVLVCSNLIISLIKGIVPKEIRIPVYIVIIASLVTVIDLLLKAYAPDVSNSLGVFIPLITVNCIILGRAEAFASKNSVLDSLLDALGMSIGFGLACLVIAVFREFLGTGGFTLTNPFNSDQSAEWLPLKDFALPVMVQGIGGFLTFGIIVGLFSWIAKTKVPTKNSDTTLKSQFNTLKEIEACRKEGKETK